MNIVLCDSAVHPTPVLRGWFYGLDQLGYNPKYLPIPNYSITQLTEEPDVLIYPYIEENLLSDARNKMLLKLHSMGADVNNEEVQQQLSPEALKMKRQMDERDRIIAENERIFHTFIAPL